MKGLVCLRREAVLYHTDDGELRVSEHGRAITVAVALDSLGRGVASREAENQLEGLAQLPWGEMRV